MAARPMAARIWSTTRVWFPRHWSRRPLNARRCRMAGQFSTEVTMGQTISFRRPDKKLPAAEYSAPAAELAWRRTLEFFDRHLK